MKIREKQVNLQQQPAKRATLLPPPAAPPPASYASSKTKNKREKYSDSSKLDLFQDTWNSVMDDILGVSISSSRRGIKNSVTKQHQHQQMQGKRKRQTQQEEAHRKGIKQTTKKPKKETRNLEEKRYNNKHIAQLIRESNNQSMEHEHDDDSARQRQTTKTVAKNKTTADSRVPPLDPETLRQLKELEADLEEGIREGTMSQLQIENMREMIEYTKSGAHKSAPVYVPSEQDLLEMRRMEEVQERSRRALELLHQQGHVSGFPHASNI